MKRKRKEPQFDLIWVTTRAIVGLHKTKKVVAQMAGWISLPAAATTDIGGI
jgi:hypothetical protein